MGKHLWRLLRGLHTVEWVVSLYEWAKNNLVKWVGGFGVSGVAMMSWAEVVPWFVTGLLILGWIIFLFYKPVPAQRSDKRTPLEERPAGGPTVRISAEAVPAVASYKEIYEITEGQLKENGIDLIANMLSEYRQECPEDGMFGGEYAIRRFRRWLNEKIANLLT